VTVILAYLVTALAGLTVLLRFRQYRLWEVATLVGLAGLANLAFRSLQDCVLVMLALSGPHLAVLLRRAAAAPRPLRLRACGTSQGRRGAWVTPVRRRARVCRRVFAGRFFRFQPLWPAACVALLAAVSLVPPLARAMPIQKDPQWPTAAVNRIEQ